MDIETLELTARECADVYKEMFVGLRDEIQQAFAEAAKQAEEDEKEDYAITVNHSVKINPVKQRAEHKVSVNVSYACKATTSLPDPNQPDLFDN